MVVAVVVQGIAIALLAVLVLGLLRSHALILRALHDLGAGLDLEREASDAASGSGSGHGAVGDGPPGGVPVSIEPGVVRAAQRPSQAAHDIVGTDLGGRPAVVEVAGSSTGPTLLAFLSSGCSVCQAFWAELGPDTPTPGGARLVVVVQEPPEESPAALSRLARPGVTVVASSAAWADYGVPGSPYLVLAEGGTVTGEGSATTWPGVRGLLEQAVEERRHAEAHGPATAAGADGTPGSVGTSGEVGELGESGPRGRDDASRIDAELLAAGIAPGHPSLHTPPDPDDALGAAAEHAPGRERDR